VFDPSPVEALPRRASDQVTIRCHKDGRATGFSRAELSQAN
jgi:hypothetical protein